MAAQGEREPGVVVMCSSVLDPMVQDISEQDIVMGELESPRKWTQSPKWPRCMTPPLPLSTKTPPDPGRIGSAGYGRHGPASRHTGTNGK